MLSVQTAAPVRGPAHRARVRGRRPEPVARRRVDARDVVLSVLGGVGILTVLWLAASAVFSLGTIVFVTGSMTPTMPTGAAAVTQLVPASALAPGDVVTVMRPGGNAPITHRIVEIAPVAGDGSARSLTLRGDANSIVDSDDYVVTEARRVIASAPGLGWAIIAAKTPAAALTLTSLVAVAIAWALWPAGERAGRRPSSEEPECTPSPSGVG